MTAIKVERDDGAVGVITIDRARAVQLARCRDGAGSPQGGPAARARRRRARRGHSRRRRRLLQRRRPEVHPRRRATPPTSSYLSPRSRRRQRRSLRRAVQADPRVHPQHHLRDPPRAQAVRRRRGRRRRGRRLRTRDGVRSRRRLRARDLRVGLQQDRADRRGELDVLSAQAHRASPRDGTGAAEPAPRSRDARWDGARQRRSIPRRRFEAETMAVCRAPRRRTDARLRGRQASHQRGGAAWTGSTHHLDRELESLARIADGPRLRRGNRRVLFAKRPPRFNGE